MIKQIITDPRAALAFLLFVIIQPAIVIFAIAVFVEQLIKALF